MTSAVDRTAAPGWSGLARALLPFADVHTTELSLSRLLRLSLFQVSVGMALVLVTGTLNRVLIVELGVAAWFVALMVSLPVVFAPLRALIGYRSDTYQSAFGWRRVPFMWVGTLLQWGGLAIMPFALLVAAGDTTGPVLYGQLAAGLAVLMIGAGLHTTQTAGLALATDLAKPELRPRVVALFFVMLLVGMVMSAVVFGWLLEGFTQIKLIRVVQGAAVVTLILNVAALWRQEPRDRVAADEQPEFATFHEAWRCLRADRGASRLLVAVGLGSAGFAMQDILLEPFGGQVLALSVGATTGLTALLAGGMLIAFAVAARQLRSGIDPHRLGGYGLVLGILAFALIALSSGTQLVALFAGSVALIGFGGGLFAVGTLTAAMGLARQINSGLALGAWGAVQATASGVAIALGGAIRDAVGGIALSGRLGPTLVSESTGYVSVYLLEIVLLFAALIAIGPLAALARKRDGSEAAPIGFARLPG